MNQDHEEKLAEEEDTPGLLALKAKIKEILPRGEVLEHIKDVYKYEPRIMENMTLLEEYITTEGLISILCIRLIRDRRLLSHQDKFLAELPVEG